MRQKLGFIRRGTTASLLTFRALAFIELPLLSNVKYVNCGLGLRTAKIYFLKFATRRPQLACHLIEVSTRCRGGGANGGAKQFRDRSEI
jgi:hypothetical protein